MNHINVFDHIYSLTLQRKRELSKPKSYSIIQIPDSELTKDHYIDFKKEKKLPLINQTVMHISENIIKTVFINNKKYVIEPKKVYTALEFYNLTKISTLVFSDMKLVDPNLIRVYVTASNTVVIRVNADISNVTVMLLAESLMYSVYNSKIDIPIDTRYPKSYMIMTDGTLEWKSPITKDGKQYIQIEPPSGKVSVVVMSPQLRLFKITPVDIGSYIYLPFSGSDGYIDVINTRIFKLNRVNGDNSYMTIPTDSDFTPLYDGIKVNSIDERILLNFIRTDVSIPLYKDLRHQYHLFRDYQSEYESDTLPEFIENYTPFTPNVDFQTDSPSVFRTKMVEASKDFIHSYKKYLEQIKSYQVITYPILETNSIILKRNPKELLFFVDGLNVTPTTVKWLGMGQYEAFFKESEIVSGTIDAIDIGENLEPYTEDLIINSAEFSVGPSSKLLNNQGLKLYEVTNDTVKVFNEIPSDDFIVDEDKNISNVIISDTYIGKHVYACTNEYNKVIQNPNSVDSLIEAPFWTTFIDSNNIHVFMNGRLIPNEKSNVYNTFLYRMLRGKTVIGMDYDADLVDGEHITAFISSKLEFIEYNVQLIDGDKIIELNDKKYPFSTKYNLVFINGKFIHPSNIKEIDTYRFSIDADSITDMCIFRPKFAVPYSEILEGIADKWSEYLSTLNLSELESLIGTLNSVSNSVKFTRDTPYNLRALTDILYNYCIKGRRELLSEDIIYIKEDMPDVLLPDGRLPISTIRTGLPRYRL